MALLKTFLIKTFKVYEILVIYSISQYFDHAYWNIVKLFQSFTFDLG